MTSPGDKALIAVLIRNLGQRRRIGRAKNHDVSFDEYGATINLKPGKTGARRDRCIFAASLRKMQGRRALEKGKSSFIPIL